MKQSPHPVYLDYQATTPLDPRVAQSMAQVQEKTFGNAASGSHIYGWQSDGVLRAARELTCRLLSIPQLRDLSFTSGATESNNWVIQKISLPGQTKLHFISQVTEHKSILEPLESMAAQGHEVTLLPVNSEGLVDEAALKAALRPNTALVTIMMANNEIGTIQDIGRLCEITHAHSQALFHTDATQAVGRVKVDVTRLAVDFLSLSSHKFYGPKGVGALYHNNRTTEGRLHPLFLGGGHEFGYRSGTVNVPGVHGLACALELCQDSLEEEYDRISALAQDLLKGITPLFQAGVILNGSTKQRLPHNISLTFPHVPANVLLTELSGFALSTGSACSTGSGSGSHVIEALRGSPEEALSTIRISLGCRTTQDEVVSLAAALNEAHKNLSRMGF